MLLILSKHRHAYFFHFAFATFGISQFRHLRYRREYHLSELPVEGSDSECDWVLRHTRKGIIGGTKSCCMVQLGLFSCVSYRLGMTN
jgi:hypothetical protein